MAKKPARSLASVIGLPAEAEPVPAAGPVPAPIAREDDRPAVVSVNVYMTPADRKRLNQLALDADSEDGERVSVQRLVREGIDLMLAKRGLPPLEPATANIKSGMRRR